MNVVSAHPRRGARRKGAVPPSVLAQIAAGEIETVNLMEWLAADMSALARNIAVQAGSERVRFALEEAAAAMADQRITRRLLVGGRALAGSVPDIGGSEFRFFAEHKSDLVRQWACYAVNEPEISRSIAERLSLTLPFAADRNMSVREAAWMAFRPYIVPRVQDVVAMLEPVSRDRNPNLRRFAIEVTRPRSVWGTHIDELKRCPQTGLSLLENVREDEVRYVQLAAGNWLNDASKSRPDWVAEICARWSADRNPATAVIVRRGLRTVERAAAREAAGYRIVDRSLRHHLEHLEVEEEKC